MGEFFHIRNCITWQREKERGAKDNRKNDMEDIWFATNSDRFTFNMVDLDPSIQGYADGVFWERNSIPAQKIHDQVAFAVPCKSFISPTDRYDSFGQATDPDQIQLDVRKDGGHV